MVRHILRILICCGFRFVPAIPYREGIKKPCWQLVFLQTGID